MLNKSIAKYITRLYVSENIIDLSYNCKKQLNALREKKRGSYLS